MRRIVLWFASTVVVLVMLFSYRTSLEGAVSTTPVISYRSAAGAGTTSSSTDAGSAGSASAAAARTVTGSAVWTRYGPVQVQVTVTGSKLTDVTVLQYPDSNGRDAEINSRALPVLVDETIQAQSAQIDMVSGATYTSQGYLQSLQAALDGAGL